MQLTSPIRIMLVDDNRLVRDSLKIFLSTIKGLEVVAEARNGEQALKLCPQFQPDVLILDMVMPGLDGAMTAKALRELCPSTKILILTSFPQGTLVRQALQAGAVGCMSKASPPEELVSAIQAVHTNPSL